MATGSIDVRVENQLVRFVCPTPPTTTVWSLRSAVNATVVW